MLGFTSTFNLDRALTALIFTRAVGLDCDTGTVGAGGMGAGITRRCTKGGQTLTGIPTLAATQ